MNIIKAANDTLAVTALGLIAAFIALGVADWINGVMK
jgi:type IV secretory pathway TrbD component